LNRREAAALSGIRPAEWLLPGLLLLVLGLVYGRTLAPGVTWANAGTDSGDLITAAATLGIAHPTGYPTYLLLARLFQYLPLGDLALRTNIFSACMAILTVLWVYWLIRRIVADPGWSGLFAAGVAALGLGLAPLFWSQAVIAEVHTLNAFCAAVILGFILSTLTPQTEILPAHARLQGLFVGLALGNHVTIALLAGTWLFTSSIQTPAQQRAWYLGQQVLGIAAGLLVYLYLPLRAVTHPAVNWGNPVDLSGFWWVISGAPYRDLAFGLPQMFLSQRLAAWAALLLQQFGWVGVSLGFVGLLYGRTHCRQFVWVTAIIAGAYSIFALTYNTADSYAYLLPVYLIFTLWIALGVHTLLQISPQRNYSRRALALLLVILLAWPVPNSARQVDASDDYRAVNYARQVLTEAPDRAIVLTTSDLDTFPLWYYHYALAERPDMFVVVEPLLEFPWYREHLRAYYSALTVPEQSGAGWQEEIAQANPGLGPVCRVELIDFSPRLHCLLEQETWSD
jgi:hypothetical protein